MPFDARKKVEVYTSDDLRASLGINKLTVPGCGVLGAAAGI